MKNLYTYKNNLELHSNIFKFSCFFSCFFLQLKELSFDISVIKKLDILVSLIDTIKDFIFDYIFNIFIIDVLVLFELNFYCMLGVIIGGILLVTVIIWIGSRILESKPINEGIKTVINIGVVALTGAA